MEYRGMKLQKKRCLTKPFRQMCKATAGPVVLKQQNNQLYVEMDLFIDCNNVGDDASHLITPVLGDQHRRMELPQVLVAGKRRYRALRWAVWGLGQRMLRPYRIRKIFNAFDRSLIHYRYRIRLSYEPWMKGAGVVIL